MFHEYDWFRLVGVGLFTLVVLAGSLRCLKMKMHRLFLVVGVCGCYIYCGFGTALSEVSFEYITYYLLGVLSIASFFVIGIRLFKPITQTSSINLNKYADEIMSSKSVWTILFLVHIIACIFMFLCSNPDWSQLLRPSAPDLRSVMFERFVEDTNKGILVALVGYLHVLSFPIYLFTLYRFSDRPKTLLLLLFVPLYLKYCSDGYASRSLFLIPLLMVWLILWLKRADLRRKLIICVLVSIPLLALFVSFYGRVRLDKEIVTTNPLTATRLYIDSNANWCLYADDVIKLEETEFNFENYFRWLATLPIPKVLIGRFDVPKINYDIAEAITGKSRTDYKFSVTLSGIIAESVYIYGPYLFWLHLAMFGMIFAFYSSIVEEVTSFQLIGVYLAIVFGYKCIGGGVCSVMPILMNSFLLFNGAILYSYYRQRVQK